MEARRPLLVSARVIRSNSYTIDLLREIAEFLDGYSDVVDGSYGEPQPNKAMYLLQSVEQEIERLKRLPSATASGMAPLNVDQIRRNIP